MIHANITWVVLPLPTNGTPMKPCSNQPLVYTTLLITLTRAFSSDMCSNYLALTSEHCNDAISGGEWDKDTIINKFRTPVP